MSAARLRWRRELATNIARPTGPDSLLGKRYQCLEDLTSEKKALITVFIANSRVQMRYFVVDPKDIALRSFQEIRRDSLLRECFVARMQIKGKCEIPLDPYVVNLGQPSRPIGSGLRSFQNDVALFWERQRQLVNSSV